MVDFEVLSAEVVGTCEGRAVDVYSLDSFLEVFLTEIEILAESD